MVLQRDEENEMIPYGNSPVFYALKDVRALEQYAKEQTNALLQVLCCCNPSNIMGYLPGSSKVLTKREAQLVISGQECGGCFYEAFESDNLPTEKLREIPGFVEAEPLQANRKKKPKWRR